MIPPRTDARLATEMLPPGVPSAAQTGMFVAVVWEVPNTALSAFDKVIVSIIVKFYYS